MKIAWIVPYKKKCGISLYAEKYAAALSAHVKIIECDPDEFIADRNSFLKKISECSLAHIQYEPLFFRAKNTDFYPAMCKAIPCKKVVTLHEVYKRPPHVFPREEIGGIWPLRQIKQMVWDARHPHWAAFSRHARNNFFSDAIFVHAQFQKPILEEKGVTISLVNVIPLPIQAGKKQAEWQGGKSVVCGATGFINPSYDYDLLFSTLERLAADWRFVWVGGARREDDAALLQSLRDNIDKRGWGNRFTITGLVFGADRDRFLADVEVFCALFKDRSSSESLADAIGAQKLIVASRIPLTEELVSQEPLAVLVDRDPAAIAQRITELASDEPLRKMLLRACAAYGGRFSYERCARDVVAVYERLVSA
jgi:glycosyltransferase involved in cell wall biosynthesis